MKTKKLDFFFVIAFLLANVSTAFSQPPQLGFSPNPESNAVCPNINVTYAISNYNPACHDISVIGGFVVNDGNDDDASLTVNWIDNGFTGSITVNRDDTSGSGCGGSAPDKTVTVPIKTLVGVAPMITGPDSAPAGFQHVLTYSAQLN